MSTPSNVIDKNYKALACDIDPEEKEFDKLVKLWVNNEISYELLLKNYPSYDSSMIKKILNSILEKIPA